MSNESPKILLLLSIIGHPRDSKRLAMLLNAGFDVTVAAFERNNYKPRDVEIGYSLLGNISHGNYFNRLIVFIKSIRTLRKLLKHRDIVYSSGLDMLFLSVIASFGREKIQICEVGDIREIQVDGTWKGAFYRKIESWFLYRTQLIVVTSRAFLTEYFHTYHKRKVRGLVLENKVDMDQSIQTSFLRYHTRSGPRIRIGYFGLLRCLWSLKVLSRIAECYGDRFEVVLAGVVIHDEFHQQLVTKKNVRYLGTYKSPDDLTSIYGTVDMIWACYQPFEKGDYNLRWARPNRFYESCFFGMPLFSRQGCQDAIEVKRLNLGCLVNDSDISVTAEKINTINEEDFSTWKENVLSLNPEVYMYFNEYTDLKKEIDFLFTKANFHE